MTSNGVLEIINFLANVFFIGLVAHWVLEAGININITVQNLYPDIYPEEEEADDEDTETYQEFNSANSIK